MRITKDGKLEVLLYGTGIVCASCVNAPSSEETASWLQSLFDRKYGEQIKVTYIDFQRPNNEEEKAFARRIMLEDLWYPVVVIEDEIVTEGNPNLKKIFKKLDQLGIEPKDEKMQ
ncbi:DUF1462 family protein [Tepidibacillus marianensis]|uniref:DUF1462 family protein n=1 Tax=Tepidibacillus marianensis TaxID=3131995 RepID=UPI0030CD8594